MTNTDYKGIVFFDADGTLVDERKGIFEPTAADMFTKGVGEDGIAATLTELGMI